MNRSEAMLERLRAGEVLLADGATGTMLQSMGLEPGEAPETWLLEQPDKIRALHRGYVEAGSDLILTCTFGGSRFRLEGHGLGDRVREINRRAGELAREVADSARDRRVFVGGDMGPTGQLLAPLGPLTEEEAVEAYAEQARGLAEGGVDFLLIETMSDLGEAKAALEGARRASDPSAGSGQGLPIFCTFSFDSHGRTMMGIRPAQAAREIAPLVEGLGANCGRDPAEYPDFVRIMRAEAPDAILWAKPNAGLPHLDGDQVIYDADPAYMADIAVQLHEAGAQVIGGCCGSGPAHIRAMAQALK